MNYLLEEMSWPEIRRAAGEGAVAVLPTGSIEQHGRHLPTRTDSLLVEAVAKAGTAAFQGEAETRRAVVAPTLWAGASDHHRSFFALSVSEGTYIDVIADLAESLAEAGFTRLFVINGHGGNSAPLRVALSELRRRVPSLVCAVADYWALAAPAFRAKRKSSAGGAAHAGEIETSLMLHLSAESVRLAEIDASVPAMPHGFEIDLIDGGPVSVFVPWESMSSDGQVGDPTVSDEESGKRFYQAAVSAFAEALRCFAALSV